MRTSPSEQTLSRIYRKKIKYKELPSEEPLQVTPSLAHTCTHIHTHKGQTSTSSTAHMAYQGNSPSLSLARLWVACVAITAQRQNIYNTHTHTHIQTHTHIYKHTHTYTNTHTHIQTHTHIMTRCKTQLNEVIHIFIARFYLIRCA